MFFSFLRGVLGANERSSRVSLPSFPLVVCFGVGQDGRRTVDDDNIIMLIFFFFFSFFILADRHTLFIPPYK